MHHNGKLRVDGSRKLRRFAIPLRAENDENVSKFVTVHDHKYTVDANQRLPFQDLTMQMNLSHDNNYISIQSEPSRSIQAAGSPVITRTNNITIENMHQDVTIFSLLLIFLLISLDSLKKTNHKFSFTFFVLV